ncbi:oxygenase MpaB family protein [Luedemannella flava]
MGWTASGRASVRQLNRIHQRFDITQDDYRYVLATLVVVPTRWVDRHGWRPLCCHEKAATAQFYSRMGRRMNIKDIPSGYAAFAEFFDDYERRFLAPSPAGTTLMNATTQLFKGRLPGRLARFAPTVANCLLDPPVRRAVGAAEPPLLARAVVGASLRTRAMIVRWFHGPRGVPFMADGIRTPSYPDGYAIEAVGPAS